MSTATTKVPVQTEYPVGAVITGSRREVIAAVDAADAAVKGKFNRPPQLAAELPLDEIISQSFGMMMSQNVVLNVLGTMYDEGELDDLQVRVGSTWFIGKDASSMTVILADRRSVLAAMIAKVETATNTKFGKIDELAAGLPADEIIAVTLALPFSILSELVKMNCEDERINVGLQVGSTWFVDEVDVAAAKAAHDAQLTKLTAELAERDTQLAEVAAAADSLNAVLIEVTAELAERNAQLAKVTAERDARLVDADEEDENDDDMDDDGSDMDDEKEDDTETELVPPVVEPVPIVKDAKSRMSAFDAALFKLVLVTSGVSLVGLGLLWAAKFTFASLYEHRWLLNYDSSFARGVAWALKVALFCSTPEFYILAIPFSVFLVSLVRLRESRRLNKVWDTGLDGPVTR